MSSLWPPIALNNPWCRVADRSEHHAPLWQQVSMVEHRTAECLRGAVVMHELETLLGRLKMEHLGVPVENLLGARAGEGRTPTHFREFLCRALQHGMERAPFATVWSRD